MGKTIEISSRKLEISREYLCKEGYNINSKNIRKQQKGIL